MHTNFIRQYTFAKIFAKLFLQHNLYPKIFTVMYFEPIVHLLAIRYLNMYVYSLFANIISIDTTYSLKLLRSYFSF